MLASIRGAKRPDRRQRREGKKNRGEILGAVCVAYRLLASAWDLRRIEEKGMKSMGWPCLLVWPMATKAETRQRGEMGLGFHAMRLGGVGFRFSKKRKGEEKNGKLRPCYL